MSTSVALQNLVDRARVSHDDARLYLCEEYGIDNNDASLAAYWLANDLYIDAHRVLAEAIQRPWVTLARPANRLPRKVRRRIERAAARTLPFGPRLALGLREPWGYRLWPARAAARRYNKALAVGERAALGLDT